MRKILSLFLVVLLGTSGVAKNVETRSTAAEIETVRVVSNGDKTKIEVKLTGAVSPRVVIASNPSRLVLELPNTMSEARQQHIAVNQEGIKGVRVGLTSTAPLLTRVVVDLDGARPYGLATTGNIVSLTVLPADNSDDDDNPPPGGTLLASGALSPTALPQIPAITRAASRPIQLGFKVKYVAEGVVYLAGGRGAGLEPGMTLAVLDNRKGPRLRGGEETQVAELRILSVAETSAVTELQSAKREIKPGDWAYLSAGESDTAMQKRSHGSGPRQIASDLPATSASSSSFMQTRPVEVEQPESGRIRGRVGLDYSGISGSIGTSTQVGVVARADFTHILGSHWNLEGYWRGRMTRHSRTDEDTLQNVLNKTYTMQLFYDNPDSKWVAGFGRLYLPWASSLDTIDGGYVGRRLGHGITTGLFLGSTPDPTSWHYNPDQQIGGSFINFEGGSGDAFRYTSTSGVAINALKWQLDRPFVFFENGVSYRNTVSVYHSLIVDAPQGLTTDGITPGAGVSRSYLTLHVQPYRRVSFDFYHNYFRDVPTAATALIGTGLVDKLLYQGVSFGVRVEPVKHYFVYTTLGKSDKTGDMRQTLNQMYGFTAADIARTGLRADLRYSKFDSSFGRGDYKLLSLSRHLGDRMMWDAQFGMQNLISPFTVNTNSRFIDTSFDTNLWGRSFLQSGYTIVRGNTIDYNQWYLSLGYRFDSRPTK
jgi:AMIN domain-containing protein